MIKFIVAARSCQGYYVEAVLIKMRLSLQIGVGADNHFRPLFSIDSFNRVFTLPGFDLYEHYHVFHLRDDVDLKLSLIHI